MYMYGLTTFTSMSHHSTIRILHSGNSNPRRNLIETKQRTWAKPGRKCILRYKLPRIHVVSEISRDVWGSQRCGSTGKVASCSREADLLQMLCSQAIAAVCGHEEQRWLENSSEHS